MKRNLKITTVVLLTITVAILCAAILIIMINHSEREPQLSSTNSDIFSVSDEVVSEENTTQDSSEPVTSSNSQPSPLRNLLQNFHQRHLFPPQQKHLYQKNHYPTVSYVDIVG